MDMRVAVPILLHVGVVLIGLVACNRADELAQMDGKHLAETLGSHLTRIEEMNRKFVSAAEHADEKKADLAPDKLPEGIAAMEQGYDTALERCKEAKKVCSDLVKALEDDPHAYESELIAGHASRMKVAATDFVNDKGILANGQQAKPCKPSTGMIAKGRCAAQCFALWQELLGEASIVSSSLASYDPSLPKIARPR